MHVYDILQTCGFMNCPLLRPCDPILSSRSSSTELICWCDPWALPGCFRPKEPEPPYDDPPPLVDDDLILRRWTNSVDSFISRWARKRNGDPWTGREWRKTSSINTPGWRTTYVSSYEPSALLLTSFTNASWADETALVEFFVAGVIDADRAECAI